MRSIPLAVLLLLVAGIGASHAQDTRELVRLPAPMQEHMLGNMWDHLATLNEIIDDVANSKFDDAKIAEQRLGMSSLSLHGAAISAISPKVDAGHRNKYAPCSKPSRHCVARCINRTDGRCHARYQPGPS